MMIRLMVLRKSICVWGVFSAVFVMSCGKKVPRNEIVFVSDRGGNQDIYLMDVDLAHVSALTQSEAEDWAPSWSPDGEQLTFASTRNGGWNIYVMNVTNRKIVQLTETGKDRRPAWSPTGASIAFTSERDGNSEIYIMRSDGSEQLNITNHRARDDRPVWSPDEDRIAFSSNRDGDWEVYIQNLEADTMDQITDTVGPDFPGAWAADGRSILLFSAGDIIHYSFESEEVTLLTRNESKEGTPSYSPDGTLILFESDRSGDYDIWIMKADGTEPKNLTNNPAFDWFPQWRPPH